jgi:hypothetical protein
MPTHYYTTQAKADAYDAVIDVFNSTFRELKEMGKKKPDATLSVSKIKTINRVLEDAKAALEGEATYKYLDLLDSDDAPQFGDAILLLSQYEGALATFRGRSWGWYNQDHTWFIK